MASLPVTPKAHLIRPATTGKKTGKAFRHKAVAPVVLQSLKIDLTDAAYRDLGKLATSNQMDISEVVKKGISLLRMMNQSDLYAMPKGSTGKEASQVLLSEV